ncbi:MAG: hypothetical protein IT516_02000 [Burkholderiales bacterium]|nr:hypothetical protein [Burkholderiales bacterium]
MSYDTVGKPIEYFVSALDVTRFEFHTRMDAPADDEAAHGTPASPGCRGAE